MLLAGRFVLRATENRYFTLAFIGIVMVLGYFWLRGTEVLLYLTWMLAVGVPVAVLIPPFLLSGNSGPEPGLKRILSCYLVVSFFAALAPFLLLEVELAIWPDYYLRRPVPDWTVQVGSFIIYTVLAAIVYHVMGRYTKFGKESTRSP